MKLMIRKMTDQDLEPLCVLLSDPDVMRYLEPPYSNEQTRKFLSMIVGNHSYSHSHFSVLSLSEGICEIDRCEAVLNQIYDMAGMKRIYRPFRFPYGDKGQKNKDDYAVNTRLLVSLGTELLRDQFGYKSIIYM